MTAPRTNARSGSGNARLALMLGGMVCAMIGLAFASVPLYQLFCQVTGFGGTTQVAEALPETLGERTIRVRFNADISADLPWRFQPEVREVTLQVGEQGLVFYKAASLAEATTWGTATFNVTPLAAGQYFNKIECFCFTEQRLDPGESMDMGVSFFVDPAIEQDPQTAKIETITEQGMTRRRFTRGALSAALAGPLLANPLLVTLARVPPPPLNVTTPEL